MTYTTRVAPSPTGDMHLGTARTCYFNWLAARASGGKFILRIDDTDTDRNVSGVTDAIKNTLDWLGLDWDDEFSQADRSYDHVYHDVAMTLLDKKLAKHADNGAILLDLHVGNMAGMSWNDTIGGKQAFTDGVMKNLWDRDIVLIKSNHMPSYHFASTVDDITMGVNWIIRGSDHLNNTFVHSMIAHAMGEEFPQCSHLGLITMDKKKMSKRDGAASMLAYRDAGYDADAMLDYMLRLGWSPKGGVDPKVITRDMALDMFLDGNLRSSPAGFDKAKLDNLDRRHKGRKGS